MSIKKRLRVLWAAVVQDWHEHVCPCGATEWVQGNYTWTEQCVSCEVKQMNKWAAEYEARTTRPKGAA